LAWAAVLAVGTAALVGGLLMTRPDDRSPYSTSGLMSSPGGNRYPANVQPVMPAPTGSPTATPHVPLVPGYSLAAVAAVDAGDVWAVGKRSDPGATALPADGRPQAGHSFILHYDGLEWRETPSPDVGPLRAVAATARGDVWALGSGGAILHWAGREWAATPTPVTDGVVALYGLTATALGDAWAVGSRDGAPLVLHWDGATWHAADLPAAPNGDGTLKAVAGSAANLWAVGADADGMHALALHWDGARWSYVADTTVSDGGLSAVASMASDDVWAGGPAAFQHWDGTQWRDLRQSFGGVLGSIVALSSNDVWVGAATGPAHWDGRAWQLVTAEQMGLTDQTSVGDEALAASSPTDVWAAGTIAASAMTGGSQRPLVAHWDVSGWHVVVDSVQSK
jgi:hypothetical protein